MAEKSKLCDYTFAPWRFVRGELCRTSNRNWRQKIKWIANAGIEENRRPRVALSVDVFDNAVPDEWRVELFGLMSVTPHLDWLLLTKRVGNAMEMLERCVIKIESHPEWSDKGNPPQAALRDWLANWFLLRLAPKNIWLGVTVCNQDAADRDIPMLLATPAAVRFVSTEPMLGPVDLAQACAKFGWTDNDGVECCAMPRHLDWVICGGETGKHARPMHPGWVRSLRDQCQRARVPFFFKQWGEYVEWDGSQSPSPSRRMSDMTPVVWVGGKAAGRLLDGRIWDEVPEC